MICITLMKSEWVLGTEMQKMNVLQYNEVLVIIFMNKFIIQGDFVQWQPGKEAGGAREDGGNNTLLSLVNTDHVS